MITHQESKLINLSSEHATQNYNSTFLSNLSFTTPGLVIRNPLISKSVLYNLCFTYG